MISASGLRQTYHAPTKAYPRRIQDLLTHNTRSCQPLNPKTHQTATQKPPDLTVKPPQNPRFKSGFVQAANKARNVSASLRAVSQPCRARLGGFGHGFESRGPAIIVCYCYYDDYYSSSSSSYFHYFHCCDYYYCYDDYRYHYHYNYHCQVQGERIPASHGSPERLEGKAWQVRWPTRLSPQVKTLPGRSQELARTTLGFRKLRVLGLRYQVLELRSSIASGLWISLGLRSFVFSVTVSKGRSRVSKEGIDDPRRGQTQAGMPNVVTVQL